MKPRAFSTETSEKCHLHEAPMYQCCCNCKLHIQDFHHCTLNWDMREKHGGCVCGIPKGWVCIGMAVESDWKGGVHSGWPEHSIGCEMYQPIKKFERPKEPA